MTRIYAVFLAFTIVLASCAPEVPDYYDWCYLYDFRESVDGINVLDGTWVDGTGIITDETGLMRLNWVHSQSVQANHITVSVARGQPGSTAFDVTANAIIFGIGASFTQSFPYYPFDPSEETTLPVFFQPDTNYASSPSANIAIEAAEPFVLASVLVRGIGANPFDRDDCNMIEGTSVWTPPPTQDWNFPTPGESPTPTPTLTPTVELPTLTPEPTHTTSATLTPDCSATWIHVLDFRTAPYPYILGSNPSKTTYTSGEGYEAIFSAYVPASYSDMSQQVQFRLPAATHLKDIDVMVSTDAGSADMARWPSTPGGGLSVSVHWVTNTNPPTADWTNNSFIEPYNKSETWVSMYNDGASMPGVMWINVALTTEYGYLPQTSFVNTIHALRLTGTGVNPFTGVCGDALTPTVSPTPTATNTPTQTATFTRTPLPTVTLGAGTVTRTVIAVASPTLGATSTPITPSAIPPTLTPSPTRTLIPPPTAYQTITPWPTPEGTPPPLETPTPEEGEDDGENRILDAINSFGTWVQNGFNSLFDLLGQGINWAIGTANNFGTLVGNLIQAIVGLIENIFAFLGELWEIVKLLLAIVVRLVQLFFAWIGEMSARITALLTAFWQAPLAPIPGLPLCTSNPTAHDLCAIYYILDWTIFAPGTPGELIIPLTLINLDIWMIIYFVRFVLKLVRKGERITNVG
jgi:hypothetical protein